MIPGEIQTYLILHLSGQDLPDLIHGFPGYDHLPGIICHIQQEPADRDPVAVQADNPHLIFPDLHKFTGHDLIRVIR